MKRQQIKFRDWEFEVDRELTLKTYQQVSEGSADYCQCSDCKNYVAYRDNVFPDEIKKLFVDLGIDYRKESEIWAIQVLPNGLHHILGWFHFKGRLLSGNDCMVPWDVEMPDSDSGFSVDMTKIHENFSIGFSESDSLAYFEDKTDLVQVEFETYIPWVIDKSLEIK